MNYNDKRKLDGVPATKGTYIPSRNAISPPKEEPSKTDELSFDDKFTRRQIICYLCEMPLGYKSETEHQITEDMMERIISNFLNLSPDWQPSQSLEY